MQTDFLSLFLDYLLKAFLPILAAAIAGWVFYKAKGLAIKLKTTNPELYKVVEYIIRQVVLAAENAGAEKLIDDKKDYAIAQADIWLRSQGIKLNLQTISTLIEAAVWEEWGKYKHDPEFNPQLPDPAS